MKAIVNARVVLPQEIVENGVVLMEDGKILASGRLVPPKSAELVDAHGLWAGPGYIDIHCHGGGSWDISENPAAMALHHLRHGTTSLTASAYYSQTKESFLRGIRLTLDAMKSPDSSIIGMHFEGPFTNPAYGSNSKAAWPFSTAVCKEIFDAAEGKVLHCTYAPELPFAPEFEAFLQERGVVADVGHTQMSPDDLDRAINNGARIVTHLFDAMGCWRGNDTIMETGVIQETAAEVALSREGLYYELICDCNGVHVKPANVRLALRTAGPDHVIVITDSTTCNYDPSLYGPDDPHSSIDLNYNDQNELSGSRLTMEQSVRNFKRFTGAPMDVVFRAASLNAATALHVTDRVGSLLPGRDANVILCDDDMHIDTVFFHGEPVAR